MRPVELRTNNGAHETGRILRFRMNTHPRVSVKIGVHASVRVENTDDAHDSVRVIAEKTQKYPISSRRDNKKRTEKVCIIGRLGV